MKRIQVLDGWRLASVTMVIVSHLFWSPPSIVAPASLLNFGGLGLLGVDIFFFISGFVICGGLLFERTSTGRFSIGAFYIRRFFRIVPALYLFLAFVTLLGAAGLTEQNLGDIVRSALFTCNYFDCEWDVGHTWSLAVEEQFYLTFPLMFGLILRARPVLIALVALAGLLIVIAAYYFKAPTVAKHLFPFCHLLIGVYCAMDYRRLEILVRPVPSWRFDLAAVVMAAISVLPPSKVSTLAVALAQPLLIAFVLLGTIVHRTAITRFFTIGIVCAIGRMSYGIYLWQQLAFVKQDSPYDLLLLFLLIGLAALSFYAMERPLMRLGKRLIGTK